MFDGMPFRLNFKVFMSKTAARGADKKSGLGYTLRHDNTALEV